jgi:flagellar hook protein FlgE
MGIFDALTTAVSGLQAQSFALQNISGNIANSQTTAFKETNTSFRDLVTAAAQGQQPAGSVTANSVATNSIQGSIQTTSVRTDMAINGDGYFVVAKPDSFTDNRPVFSGINLYSRRGDFREDASGFLVNGAGYYLMGIPIDPTTGNPTGSIPTVLQFENNLSSAVSTTQVQYGANLPSYPVTPSSSAATPGSELLDPASYTVDPTMAGTGTVVGNDVTVFLSQSLSGGALTAYDSLGAPQNIQFRWAKVDSIASGGTDTWELFYQTDANATGATVAWQNADTSFAFDVAGRLSPAIPSLTLTGVTINGVTLGDVQVSFGANALTQFADTSGTVQVNHLQQNGSPAGKLQSISVNDKNRVVGTYTNGRTIDLAQITLASFNGENKLQALDGGAYAATFDSGQPLYTASGSIVGGSLEGSNVDIASEFSKLIVTQQAYSSNAKVIQAANQMVQSLLAVIQ